MLRTLPLIVLVTALSACGAPDVRTAIRDADTHFVSTVQGSCADAFDSVLTSRHATSADLKHKIDRQADEGMIWFANDAGGVFSVVDFSPTPADDCQVDFYHYGGAGKQRLRDIQAFLNSA